MKASVLKWGVVFSLLLGVVVAPAMSGEEHDHGAPKVGTAEFEKMKSLAGRWEGTAKHEDGV